MFQISDLLKDFISTEDFKDNINKNDDKSLNYIFHKWDDILNELPLHVLADCNPINHYISPKSSFSLLDLLDEAGVDWLHTIQTIDDGMINLLGQYSKFYRDAYLNLPSNVRKVDIKAFKYAAKILNRNKGPYGYFSIRYSSEHTQIIGDTQDLVDYYGPIVFICNETLDKLFNNYLTTSSYVAPETNYDELVRKQYLDRLMHEPISITISKGQIECLDLDKNISKLETDLLAEVLDNIKQ